MIFDSHAHFDDEKFDGDREILLRELFGGRICNIVNVGASIETTKTTVALAEKHEKIYAAAGVHPSDIDGLNEESFAWLQTQLKHPKVVAVGEIGLDYYWEKEQEVQKAQQYWFARQLSLAKEAHLPVIIHSREAAEDTLRAMKQAHADNIPGVIHCYSYSPELAKEFVKMGYYIGVGGVVTFKNAKKLKETVMQIPLSKILVETDAPYLAPEPYRGRRNHSGYLEFVVKKIAELKGVSEEEVEEATEKNARELFLASSD